jgi:hypothetical protein
VNICCEGTNSLFFGDLVPFQGDLKRRSNKDIERLARNIEEVGLLTPFVVWRKRVGRSQVSGEISYEYCLLDGHARYSALQYLAIKDRAILDASYPVVTIDAVGIEEAKRLLLNINTRFGRITSDGLMKFTAGTKIDVTKMNLNIKLPRVGVSAVSTAVALREYSPVDRRETDDFVVVRVRLPVGKVDDICAVLRSIDNVEVIF